MFDLHWADLTFLGLYLVGITALGILAGRWVRTMGDFFMPRRFGKAMMVTHAFGTGTHSDQAVSAASKTYTNGLSGIWIHWLYLFSTPFYWLIAPIMRRFRAITTGDVFELRYDQSVAGLYAVIGMLHMMTAIGLMLKGSASIIDASLGETVSHNWIIAAMAVLFVSYGIVGGLAAAIITDFVQGILTVAFSFILLPSILMAVGGMAGLREQIDDPQMFSLVSPAEIGLFYIIVVAINGLVGIATQPHIMGNCAAGKSEYDGRFGFMVGNFVKRLCTMAWVLTGLAGVVYFAGSGIHPDMIFGATAREFLPAIMPGLLGIFIASLLATVMSSCDSFMVASSALFTKNIYRPMQPNREAGHYLRVGRLVALLVVLAGVGYAFWLPDVIRGVEIFWKITPIMGVAFWLGLFWRGSTPAGAWASTIAGFATMIALEQPAAAAWLAQFEWAHASRVIFDGRIYLPWQMVVYLTVATLFGVVVSLLTKPTATEKLERFYALIRTPVTAGEQVAAPCTLPPGVVVPPPRRLISAGGLEIPVPSRESVWGFLIGWFLVFVLIAGFIAVVRW
jgi:Na+/proline symporter